MQNINTNIQTNTNNDTIDAIYRLSPLQEGLLFHALYVKDNSQYNLALTWEYPQNLNTKLLQNTWKLLLNNHEVLRASFNWNDSLNKSSTNNCESSNNHEVYPLQFIQNFSYITSNWHNFWHELDWRKSDMDLSQFIEQEWQRSFELSQPLLMRFYLIKIPHENSYKYQFIWIYHHILFDGWCLPLLLNELHDYYHSLYKQKEQKLHYRPSYSDYIDWLEEQNIAQAQEYWHKILHNFSMPTTLPTIFTSNLDTHTAISPKNLGIYTAEIEEIYVKKLKTLAQNCGVTLNSILQFAWSLILYVYSGNENVVHGTVVSGRSPEIENIDKMIGLFINTLPLHNQIDANLTVKQHLKILHKNFFLMTQYAYLSLNNIRQQSGIVDDNSLFYSLLIFENYPVEKSISIKNVTEQNCNTASKLSCENFNFYETSSYPLTLFIYPNTQLTLQMRYNTKLFTTSNIATITQRYIHILQNLLTYENAKIAHMNFLLPHEHTQIHNNLNNTQCIWQHHNALTTQPNNSQDTMSQSILSCIYHQVITNPQAIALIDETTELTYEKLWQKSFARAEYISQHYPYIQKTLTEPEQQTQQHSEQQQKQYQDKKFVTIATCTNRNVQAIINMLAIQILGATYIPLSPLYPLQKIKDIINDADCQLILTQNAVANFAELQSLTVDLLDVDNIATHETKIDETKTDEINTSEIISDQKVLNKIKLNVDNINGKNLQRIVYILFTSGSTGKPKGVKINELALVNFVLSMQKILQLPFQVHDLTHDLKHDLPKKSVKVLGLTSFVFDISGLEIYLPLMHGGCCVIANDNIATNPSDIMQLAIKHQIDLMQATPAMWQMIMAIYHNVELLTQIPADFKNNLQIICGGEAMPKKLAQELLKVTPHVWNFYGPTETTIWSTYYQCLKNDSLSDEFNQSVPIGKPISNTEVYVLNKNLQLLPPYAIGELYIGGDGLAQGYLNQPELTQEKFIHNPFKQSNDNTSHDTSQFLYKTGDLVYCNAQNDLEFMGRQDSQIKLHGHRIELGEIIYAMQQHSAIQQAIVVVSEKQYLLGYYVAEHALNPEEISQHLNQYLPQYMIPQVYVWLTEIPLTLNGKLNYRALPQPDFRSNTFNSSEEQEQQTRQPTTEFEQNLCKIWQQHLALDVNSCVINLTSNFFRLGGNSILAMQVCHQVSKLTNLNIPLITLFKHPRLQDFAKQLTAMLKTSEETNTTNIDIPRITNTESQIPLSFAQERLWFIEKYEQGTSVYNIPLFYVLRKQVNAEKLLHCLQTLIVRHEILHTVIAEDSDGNAYQKLLNLKEKPIHINHKTLPNLTDLDTQLAKDLQHIFDLTQDYPIKIGLYNVCDKQYLSIIIHHIMFDGWSVDILLRELEDLYLDKKLQSIELQYRDFALWQRQYLTVEHLANTHQEYWQTQLADYTTLNLLTDKLRPSQIDYAGDNLEFILNENLTKQLKTLAQELNISLYSVLLGGFALLLQVYSNQDDIILGTPVANRPYLQLKNMLGFFVNMLPLRLQIAEYTNPNPNLNQNQNQNQNLNQNINSHNSHTNNHFALNKFLQYIANSVIQAQEHENLPFAKLIEMLKIPQDMSKHPLFEVTFGLQNFGSDQNSSILELYNKESELYKVAKFALSLFLSETINADNQEILIGSFNYATSLWHAETIQTYITTYINILQGFAERKNRIQYLNPTQEEQILHQWNAKYQDYPHDKTIKELFEEQTLATPNNLALIYDDGDYNLSNLSDNRNDAIDKKSSQLTLTYTELNAKANQFARYLQERFLALTTQAIQSDTLIAVCLPRSLDLIIAILAIIKVGGAYVPLDPEYPSERKKYILQDTQTKLLITEHNITEHNIANDFANMEYVPEIVFMPNDWTNFQYANTNLPTNITSTNLAYIIYTSGTTGKPKGVIQTHANVMRLFTATQNKFNFNKHDVWVLFHALVFDFSVWELWGALLHGGKLLVTSHEQTRDPAIMYQLCVKHKVTVFNQTPNAFYQWQEIVLQQSQPLSALRYIIFGGEMLNFAQLQKWFTQYNDTQPLLINMYGITETTVHVTYKEIKKHDVFATSGKSILGKVIPDLLAYVLRNDLTPVPCGAIGELYVGGNGLARGYLNQSQLTQERFIKNQFFNNNNFNNGNNLNYADNFNLLYKTGDLVHWTHDSELVYVGRNDAQVKIRGHRIEVKEIENILLSYPLIQQALVILQKDSGSNYLVAYYVAKQHIEKSKLVNFLHEQLPEYMQPRFLIYIDKIPLTINGKINFSALPQPQIDLNNSQEYVAPHTQIEQTLVKIWSEILHLDVATLSVTSDFFALGGDSILAIRLISAINKFFQIELRVKNVFLWRCIAKFAEHINDEINQKSLVNLSPNFKHSKTLYQKFSLMPQMLQTQENFTYNIDLYEDIYPASYLQIGMLWESSLNSRLGVYHDVFAYKIKHKFNEKQFVSLINKLIAKHELLRASFVQLHDEYWVFIHKFINDFIYIHDVSSVQNSPHNNTHYDYYYQADTQQLIEQEKRQHFIDDQAGLFKIIVNAYEDYFVFIFSFHHAIADGWSIASLINELVEAYIENKEILPNITLRYGEYIQQEQSILHNQTYNQFWQDYLHDYVMPQATWLKDEDINITPTNQLYKQHFQVNAQDAMVLKNLAQANQVSVDNIFLLVYLRTLACFLHSNDLVVGVVVNNRLEQEDSEKLFGLFLNTIPLRWQYDAHQNHNQALQQLFAEKIKLHKYQLTPYAKIKNLMRQDLYQYAFNFVHFHVLNVSEESLIIEDGFERTNIPLVLHVSQTQEDNFDVYLIAQSTIISEAWSKYLLEYYQHFLQVVLYNKETIMPNDRHKQIFCVHGKKQHYSQKHTLHELFLMQVLRMPNNLAVVYKNHRITYDELNNRANQLAYYIRERYFQYSQTTNQLLEMPVNTIIGLYVDKSIEMIVGMLAILKAGGAFLPLDINLPQERLHFMLKEADIKFVLTQNKPAKILQNFTDLSLQIVNLDAEHQELSQQPKQNLPCINKSSDLAYVIYTSGSTGKPKGVLIPHKNVINLISYITPYFAIKAKTKVLQFSALSFDAMIYEVFPTLCAGGELQVLETNGLLNYPSIIELLYDKNIEVAMLPPAVLQEAINYLLGTNKTQNIEELEIPLSRLRTVISGGEACTEDIVNVWAKNCLFINAYGPTETTVACCMGRCYPNQPVTIGKPIANVQAYVLDEKLNLLPYGVVGELYIAGNGIADGYLNQPQLTQERFIQNPFNNKNIMYKTGDLVRWNEESELIYVGRNDNQVKINGYRIELNEITTVLSTHYLINNAIVIANNQQIYAFFVTYKNLKNVNIFGKSTIEILRDFLQTKLPHYMIPNHFVELEVLPVNLNGKIDQTQLLDYLTNSMMINNEVLSTENQQNPRNQKILHTLNQEDTMLNAELPNLTIIKKLQAIWAKFLKINLLTESQIDINADFIALGGNSLLAIKIMNAIRLEWQGNLHLMPTMIFQHHTIKNIADIIAQAITEAINKNSINGEDYVF